MLMMKDPLTNKRSVTITYSYWTFILAFVSVCAFHFHPALSIPVYTSITFWFLATVLYMLRKLTKVKADLNDRSIELDSSDSPDETPSPESSKQPDNPDA